MKCCQQLRNFSVVMKLVAMLLNMVTVCLWGVCGSRVIPPYESPPGPVLIIHALAGCLFALPTLLLAQTLGKTTGPWTQRVFLLMGFVLLLPLGVVGIYVSVKSGTSAQLVVAVLCLAVGFFLLADFVHVEKLYCWNKIQPLG